MPPRRVAYLGPVGTFSEAAARLYAPAAEHLAQPNTAAIAHAVEQGAADVGIVPIENSLEGSVPDTLDLLIHESKLSICAEVVVPIVQCLMVKAGTTLDRIRTVHSHPQSLGQCRHFLERTLPHAEQMAHVSNAAAVQEMLKREDAAAIGPERSAELYGAQVLQRCVQDRSPNDTRFVVLADADHSPTGKDKTSLCFEVQDRPGALLSVVQAISGRGINLRKIESRPSKEQLGTYLFLVDLEGHRLEPAVAAALDEIRQFCRPEHTRVFGSYPRFESERRP
ncbi:MAG: prephenate dehydratase [Dehalococcoidia bacterium]|nr:prephenate dehydratase [Dehalococcoidia bacterium]